VKALPPFRAQQWLILFVAACCVAITASLGAWQLRRAAFKEEMAQHILKQNRLLPVVNRALNAPNFIANSESYLQRSVQLQGRWLHEHTVFLDNRAMAVKGSQRVGFYVATPLALEGGNQVIWVQRGWVQRDFQDRSKLPELPDTQGIVTVHGRLIAQVSRAFEMQGAKDGAAVDVASAQSRPSRIWQNLPVKNFAGLTLLAVAVLQTEPDGQNGAQDDGQNRGLMRDWPAPDTGVAKHHGYAFQWFALSALLVILYVWFQLLAPRRHRRSSAA
jgi:surfeit locus 1 family protein